MEERNSLAENNVLKKIEREWQQSGGEWRQTEIFCHEYGLFLSQVADKWAIQLKQAVIVTKMWGSTCQLM